MFKIGDYKIPFDEKGNQLGHWDKRWTWVKVDWIQNFSFQDELTYSTYERGRSSAIFKMVRLNGKTVDVFMSDADVLIPKMRNGKVAGLFTFVKKGTNYGCKLLEVDGV